MVPFIENLSYIVVVCDFWGDKMLALVKDLCCCCFLAEISDAFVRGWNSGVIVTLQ